MQKRGEYFAKEQDTAWLIIHCLNKFCKTIYYNDAICKRMRPGSHILFMN